MNEILILCGGRGKRMGKRSLVLPKPLQIINRKSILEHKIRYYYEQGIRKIIIAIGYKGKVIKENIDMIKFPEDLIIEYSDIGISAGILKRISSTVDLFDDNYILFSYGDTFTNLDINNLIKSHVTSDNDATIVVAPFRNPFGLIEFDSNYKIKSYKEKPILNYYIGYAIINKHIIETMEESLINMEDGNGIVCLYESLTYSNRLGAYYHKDLHITFNTPEELKIAKKDLGNFITIKE